MCRTIDSRVDLLVIESLEKPLNEKWRDFVYIAKWRSAHGQKLILALECYFERFSAKYWWENFIFGSIIKEMTFFVLRIWIITRQPFSANGIQNQMSISFMWSWIVKSWIVNREFKLYVFFCIFFSIVF